MIRHAARTLGNRLAPRLMRDLAAYRQDLAAVSDHDKLAELIRNHRF